VKQESISAAEYVGRGRKAKRRATEAQILKAVLSCLSVCPHVARAWRQNQGGMKGTYTRKSDGVTKSRFVRFAGVDGISDVIGYMRDGRFLAVECKREGEHPTETQRQFLDGVIAAGGVAIVARSADDVMRGIAAVIRIEKEKA
jgi:hypothetical protein